MSNSADAIFAMLDNLADALGKEAILEVVQVYEDNSQKQLNQMEEAVRTKDHHKLKQEAHSLKSSSANLGAQELADVCLKVEKSAALDDQTISMVTACRALRDQAAVDMNQWRTKQGS